MPKAMAGTVPCRKAPWPTYQFPVSRLTRTLECEKLEKALGGWGEVIGMYADDLDWYLRELPNVANNVVALRLWLGDANTPPGLCCT